MRRRLPEIAQTNTPRCPPLARGTCWPLATVTCQKDGRLQLKYLFGRQWTEMQTHSRGDTDVVGGTDWQGQTELHEYFRDAKCLPSQVNPTGRHVDLPCIHPEHDLTE